MSTKIFLLSVLISVSTVASLPWTDVFLVISPAEGTDESLKVYQKPEQTQTCSL